MTTHGMKTRGQYGRAKKIMSETKKKPKRKVSEAARIIRIAAACAKEEFERHDEKSERSVSDITEYLTANQVHMEKLNVCNGFLRPLRIIG